MEIKCIEHPNSKAIFICEDCGFLCANHIEEQNNRKHKLLVVDDSIKDYYYAIVAQQRSFAQLSFISQARQSIEDALGTLAYHYDELNYAALQNLKKCQSAKLGVDIEMLNKAICHSIKLNAGVQPNDKENGLQILNKPAVNLIINQAIKKNLNYKYETKHLPTNSIGTIPSTFKMTQKINTINISKSKDSIIILPTTSIVASKIAIKQTVISIKTLHNLCVFTIPKYLKRAIGLHTISILKDSKQKVLKAIRRSNSVNIPKYSETDWDNIFSGIIKKYGEKNLNIQIAKTLSKTKKKEESN